MPDDPGNELKGAGPVHTPNLSVEEVYKAQRKALKLSWLAGKNYGGLTLETVNADHPGLALVGYMNLIHPNRVQVIGNNEIDYLNDLPASKRDVVLQELFTQKQSILFIVTSTPMISILKKCANQYNKPLVQSDRASPVVIEHLQYYLTRALAPRITIHGVYSEVMGMGVLITGESGIGKSELALELLTRNHRLIADDVVEVLKVGPDVLVGQCPESIIDYIEVRGLGLLNIRDMFGQTAVRHKKKLHFIIHLESPEDISRKNIDRLQAELFTKNILGVEVPQITLFVAPGRNLAVLVETATRVYIQRKNGVNTLDEFMKRHNEQIEKNSE